MSHARGPVASLLVLAHPEDATAARVAARLVTRHGDQAVRVLTADELVFAARWRHCLSADGSADGSRATFRDGLALEVEGVGTVWNRLRYLPVPATLTQEPNRTYAQMELHALVVSFLAAMGARVIPVPTPRSIGGREPSPLEWRLLAAQAGFTAARWGATSNRRQSPVYGLVEVAGPAHRTPVNTFAEPGEYGEALSPVTASLLVVGDDCLATGPATVPAEWTVAARRLARACGQPILRVDLATAESCETCWRFVGAAVQPQLTREREIAAVAAFLERVSGMVGETAGTAGGEA
jgi:hypothetical protein